MDMASAPVFRLASYLRADAPVESAETWMPAGMTLACFNGEVKKAVNLDTSSADERIACFRPPPLRLLQRL
jgi:hypothetical protein